MRRGEEERRAVERQSLEELRRGVEEESCGGVEEELRRCFWSLAASRNTGESVV